MAAGSLHISISAEPIAHIGGLTISNSMFASLIVSALLIIFAMAVRSQIKHTGKPRGLQNLAEMIIETLYNLIHAMTESDKKTRHFFPLITTFFLFIMMNNWLGLFPGVGTIGFFEKKESTEHAQVATVYAATSQIAQETGEEGIEVQTNLQEEEAQGEATGTIEFEEAGASEVFVPYLRAGTADLNTTLALALITVFMTQVFGFSYLKLSYFSKFINFSSPIAFPLGLLELVLELAKILSFAFRLFGNIFAGEVLLAVMTFLIPIILPMPFYGLEIAVGVLQALIFAILSIVFFNMATLGHEEH